MNVLVLSDACRIAGVNQVQRCESGVKQVQIRCESGVKHGAGIASLNVLVLSDACPIAGAKQVKIRCFYGQFTGIRALSDACGWGVARSGMGDGGGEAGAAREAG